MFKFSKKIIFFNLKFLKKLNLINSLNLKKYIKTWFRNLLIIPQLIGFIVSIHNGKKHIPIFVNKEMLNHKLGEFVFTKKIKN